MITLLPQNFRPLLALAATAVSLAAAEPPWKLVWSDEFDRPGHPDPARWGYEVGFVRNHEAQYYTRDRLENVRLENGHLVIEARRERYPIAAAADGRRRADYTSGSVVTRGLAEWRYGRIEVRARLPRGRGIWPAIWLLGSNIGTVGWPACGEIDVMEYVGWMPDTIHGNIHASARYAGHVDPVAAGMKAMLHVPDSDQFHVYAVEWDHEHIRISCDGRVYLTYANPHTGLAAWPFDQPFYLLMNVAVGGSWGGEHGIDNRIFPQRMEIDYVRVYQRRDSGA